MGYTHSGGENMPKRINVLIETHYATKAQCIEMLVDHHKKTFLGLFMKQLSGKITIEGEFEISSRNNAGALFDYKGHVIENDDRICLEGDIKVKRISFWFVLLSCLFIIPISLVYVLAWGSFGIAFMIIIVIDLSVLWWLFIYSDALYKDILKKVA